MAGLKQTPEERLAKQRAASVKWRQDNKETVLAYTRAYNALIAKWRKECRKAADEGKVAPRYPVWTETGERALPKMKDL